LKYKGIPEPTNSTIFHFAPIDQTFTIASANSDVHVREEANIKTKQGVDPATGKPVFFNHTTVGADGKATTVQLPYLVDAGSTPAQYTNQVRAIPPNSGQTISIHPGVGVQTLYDISFGDTLVEIRHKCQSKNVIIAGSVVPKWVGDIISIGTGMSFLYPLSWGTDKMEIMALYFHPTCISSPMYWSADDKKKSGIDIEYPGTWYPKIIGQFKCHTTDNVETQKTVVVDLAKKRVIEGALHDVFTNPSEWALLVKKLGAQAPYGVSQGNEHEFSTIKSMMATPAGFKQVVEALASREEFDTLAERAVELGIAAFVDGRWMFTIGTESRAIPNVGNKEHSLHECVMNDEVFAVSLSRMLDNARMTIARNRGRDDNPNIELTKIIDMAIMNGEEWIKEGRQGNVPENCVYLNDAGMWCGFNQVAIIGVGNAATPEEKRAVLHSHWEGKINKTWPLKRVIETFTSKVTDPRKK